MGNDSASFWADIKNYEDQLARNPDSLLFARLAEVYLKVGLVDDALHTARLGVEKHPGYMAGQRTLAMACHAKGFHDECREALCKVTTALPEDGEALKMLGRLLSADGNKEAAINAFRTVLEFNPEDMECILELETLDRSSSPPLVDTLSDEYGSSVGGGVTVDNLDAEFGTFEDETDESEDIIEDIEIIDVSESDLLEFEEPDSLIDEDATPGAAEHDPLYTTTLAELYLQQGFIDKALEIYHTLLISDPDNVVLSSRVKELESSKTDGKTAIAGKPEVLESISGMKYEEPAPTTSGASASGVTVNAIEILEGWLDNIRRIKECR